MDPRHPELAIERVSQLYTQFTGVLERMRMAGMSAELSKLEREGGLIVQELCLVAPRLHEAMASFSRQRRREIANGMSFYTPPNQAEVEIAVLPKTRKTKKRKVKK